jgi:hypothetical protein
MAVVDRDIGLHIYSRLNIAVCSADHCRTLLSFLFFSMFVLKKKTRSRKEKENGVFMPIAAVCATCGMMRQYLF